MICRARSGKDCSKFFHCRDRLLSWRRNRLSGGHAIRQDLRSVLATKRRSFLRACTNPAATVVDLYSCSTSSAHRGRVADWNAGDAIACCLSSPIAPLPQSMPSHCNGSRSNRPGSAIFAKRPHTCSSLRSSVRRFAHLAARSFKFSVAALLKTMDCTGRAGMHRTHSEASRLVQLR